MTSGIAPEQTENVGVSESGFVTMGPPPDASGAAQSAPLVPSMLAPPRPGGEVVRLLENSTIGLPPPTEEFKQEDYDSKLQLDYVGQPYVVAGANRFGSFVGGGVSFVLSDMLGDRTLGELGARRPAISGRHLLRWRAAGVELRAVGDRRGAAPLACGRDELLARGSRWDVEEDGGLVAGVPPEVADRDGVRRDRVHQDRVLRRRDLALRDREPRH